MINETQSLKINPANRIRLVSLILIIASSLLLLASRSSPLYPLNNWTDANTFFTLGKGMMRGKVLYRDLFDHKGPLQYFIYGLASLISYKSFLGVYLLESIAFSGFLLFALKTFGLFVNWQYALLALPILAASLVNLRSFAYGGTAELFSLPFLMAGLFYFTDYFMHKYPQAPANQMGFLQGILAGCVLWIKYSFLGFWLGWMAVVALSLFTTRQFLLFLKYSALFLAGMLAATLPWMLYFSATGALGDWFKAYFVVNLTAYSGDRSLIRILQTAVDSFQRHLQFNPLGIGIMALGVLLFSTLKQYIKPLWFRLGLLLSIGLLASGVYANGRDYIYYFFVFSPYIVFGFIHLAQLFQKSYGDVRSRLLFILMFLTSLLLSIAYTYRFNRNIDFMQTRQEDMAQFQFAEILEQSDHPRLLNYGFQDSGFYTAAGLLPEVKYYQKYNLEYGQFPINMDEQNRYILEGVVDFVVIRNSPGERPPDLNFLNFAKNYQPIVLASQFFGEQEFIYELYQRR